MENLKLKLTAKDERRLNEIKNDYPVNKHYYFDDILDSEMNDIMKILSKNNQTTWIRQFSRNLIAVRTMIDIILENK